MSTEPSWCSSSSVALPSILSFRREPLCHENLFRLFNRCLDGVTSAHKDPFLNRTLSEVWIDAVRVTNNSKDLCFPGSLLQVQIASLQNVKDSHEINAKNFHFYGIFRLYFIFQAAVGLNRSHNACDTPNTKRNYKMWQFLKCVSCCITNSQCCRLN